MAKKVTSMNISEDVREMVDVLTAHSGKSMAEVFSDAMEFYYPHCRAAHLQTLANRVREWLIDALEKTTGAEQAIVQNQAAMQQLLGLLPITNKVTAGRESSLQAANRIAACVPTLYDAHQPQAANGANLLALSIKSFWYEKEDIK